jgi:hypothetical protein
MATKLVRISEKLYKDSNGKGKTTSQAIDNHVAELEARAKAAVTEDKLRRVVKDAVQEALEGMRQ